MFFSFDDPSDIIRLTEGHPEFRPLYELIYRICRNMEKVMGIFSEELLWLDRNTTQYMIDEMQDEIDEMKGAMDEMKSTINQQQLLLAEERQKARLQLAEERQKMQLLLTEEQQKVQNQNLITLIKQVRNLTTKGISPEECALLLDADECQVRTIHELLQKYPNAQDADIYNYMDNSTHS